MSESTIGERIKIVRKKLKLTQTEFSEKLGISYGAVSMIERGINNVSVPVQKLICSKFHVSMLWLETGEGEMFVESEDVSELIDEKLDSGSEFTKALLRVIAKKSDEELIVIERLFEDLQEEMKNQED